VYVKASIHPLLTEEGVFWTKMIKNENVYSIVDKGDANSGMVFSFD